MVFVYEIMMCIYSDVYCSYSWIQCWQNAAHQCWVRGQLVHHAHQDCGHCWILDRCWRMHCGSGHVLEWLALILMLSDIRKLNLVLCRVFLLCIHFCLEQRFQRKSNCCGTVTFNHTSEMIRCRAIRHMQQYFQVYNGWDLVIWHIPREI